MKFVSKSDNFNSRKCTWKLCKLTAILFRLNVLNRLTYHMHDYNSYKTQYFCGHNMLIAVNQYGSENINHKTKPDFMKSLIMFYARRSHINIVFFNWIYRFWVYYITWQCAFNDREAVDDLDTSVPRPSAATKIGEISASLVVSDIPGFGVCFTEDFQ